MPLEGCLVIDIQLSAIKGRTMKINNLEIPTTLLELLKKKKWRDSISKSKLAEISNSRYSEEYIFFSLEKMISVTDRYRVICKQSNNDAKIFGLKESKENPYAIDVEKAIIIAGNNEEEAICLYYGNDSLSPQVLESFWPTDGYCQWLKIADNFDHFLEKVGFHSSS